MDPNENQEQNQQGQETLQEGLGAPQGQEAGAQGGEAGQEGQEPPKAPERPAHWKPKPEAIPYDRFQEVASKRQQAENEAAALRAELAKLRETTAPKIDPDDPETLDPTKYTDASGNFDAAAFMRERDRRIAATAERRALESVDRHLNERDTQRQQQEVVQRTEQGFRAQVAEVAKANPQVAEAVEYLDSIAQHIPFPVQMAILRSAPEAAHAIALDQSLVEQLIRGNPAESIMLIGEINGRVKATKGAPAQAPAGGIPAFQPSAGGQAPRQAPVPRTLSGGAGNSVPSNLSTAEYIRRREKGEL